MITPMAAIQPMASAASDSDNYVYTRAQLKQKAAEQQIAIQSAEIDEKKAQIDYDGAVEKQEKGQELAKIDGVVTKVAESVESLETNEPYLVVQGSGGIMVQGNVSEMNLDKLTVGSQITVNAWDTGEMLTAEVTEIGTTPTAYTNQNGSENPNNSTYPFQAAVTDSTSLSVGSYVSLSFTSEVDSSTFYLPMSYVRQENGQYYVMRESKDKKLERQNIQTGKIIDGGKMFIPNQSWPIAYQYDEPENCLAKAVDTDSMPAVGKKVAELMNATIRTTSAGGENDSSQVKYDSQDLLKQAKSLQKLSSSTNTMLIWIASISLLVGGIGVMNIMLVSVTERTREIGLKKAIGAKKGKILAQFLTEASVLTSIGGIIGVGIGIGLAQLISKIASVPVAISSLSIVVSVVFSMVVGIVFGLIPSIKASNLNPIDALRYE